MKAKTKSAAAPAPAVRPARAAWFDWRSPYLIPLALAVFARVWFARHMPFAAEDAYITFRYAENWAHGLGPVYNVGEHVMGFSSLVWTAWLALGVFLHAPVYAFAQVSGLVFDVAALVLVARLLDAAVGRAAAWSFAVFFAVFPLFSSNAVLGMETSLLVFLAAASATAVRAKHVTAGPLLAALAWTRPEGAVVAVAIGAFAERRAQIVAVALAAVAAIGLTMYFGSPVPQSVRAKAVTYGVGRRPFSLDWIEGFIPAFLEKRWQTLAESSHLFAVSVLATPAAILGFRSLWQRDRALLGVAAGGTAVVLVYVALGVPYFGWYFVLPVFAYAVAAAAGLPSLVHSRLVWAALLAYVLTDAPFLGILYQGRNQTESRLFGAVAEKIYTANGGSSRGSVFLEPIGHVGYATGLYVIDEVGLVSPDVPKRRREGDGWYTDIVRQRRPDYLVVRPALVDSNRALAGIARPFRSFEERNQLFADYQIVGAPPASRDELVVLRRGARPDTAATKNPLPGEPK